MILFNNFIGSIKFNQILQIIFFIVLLFQQKGETMGTFKTFIDLTEFIFIRF